MPWLRASERASERARERERERKRETLKRKSLCPEKSQTSSFARFHFCFETSLQYFLIERRFVATLWVGVGCLAGTLTGGRTLHTPCLPRKLLAEPLFGTALPPPHGGAAGAASRGSWTALLLLCFGFKCELEAGSAPAELISVMAERVRMRGMSSAAALLVTSGLELPSVSAFPLLFPAESLGFLAGAGLVEGDALLASDAGAVSVGCRARFCFFDPESFIAWGVASTRFSIPCWSTLLLANCDSVEETSGSTDLATGVVHLLDNCSWLMTRGGSSPGCLMALAGASFSPVAAGRRLSAPTVASGLGEATLPASSCNLSRLFFSWRSFRINCCSDCSALMAMCAASRSSSTRKVSANGKNGDSTELSLLSGLGGLVQAGLAVSWRFGDFGLGGLATVGTASLVIFFSASAFVSRTCSMKGHKPINQA